MFCSMRVNGEVPAVGRGIGIKLMALPTGSVRRFARSKVWEKVAGSSTAVSPRPDVRLVGEPTSHRQNHLGENMHYDSRRVYTQRTSTTLELS
jgi:hypothetical protein